MNFIDYVFYVFSYSITFNNTQKLISIVTLISKDINDNYKMQILLNKMFADYEVVFNKNIYDIINLLLLCCDFKLELKKSTETRIMKQVYNVDDPVVYATWLLYCEHNNEMLNEHLTKCLPIVQSKLHFLENKIGHFFMYSECWFLFIFKNCPFCDVKTQQLITSIIQSLESNITNNTSSSIAKKIVINFLKKPNKGFFLWDYSGRNVSEQITYRTFQKTIFRQNTNKYKMFDYASF